MEIEDNSGLVILDDSFVLENCFSYTVVYFVLTLEK